MIQVRFNESSMDDYETFLRLKSCPAYSWRGETAIVPDEYAGMVTRSDVVSVSSGNYTPSPFCFDYQRDVARIAIAKQKYAVFADCGLGKTIILLEFAQHASQFGKVLIVSPLMVCRQTIEEAKRFYPGMDIGYVAAADLPYWMNSTCDGTQIAITNYEAIKDGLPHGKLAALILDESSMLKSQYGTWGTRLIELGKGVPYKLALTGTPAPNDRIEYANHAVFLDRFRTPIEFMARYFVNKGQTQERWTIRPHALRPFYRDMSDWCIFLTNPATYGWKDNCETIPPIHVHIDQVPLTNSQREQVRKLTGCIVAPKSGGIGQRSKLAQIAKSEDSLKYEFIRGLVDSWPDESTIIWCRYNHEQKLIEQTFGDRCVSISGDTPQGLREQYIDDFKAGRISVLTSKPKILGFGLNLQIATRQIFSGLQDSYEEFYQCVKRSNRIGSTRPLNVHIPVTEIEEPMVSNVLEKAHRVQADAEEQEALFREFSFRMEVL